LQVNAVETLDAAVELDHRHLRLFELGADRPGELADDASALLRFARPSLQRLVGLRLEDLKASSSSSFFDLAHPEPVGDRARRYRAFPGRFLTRRSSGRWWSVRMLCQAIGELDEDDADVIDHRQQHLAEVLGLPLSLDENGDRPILVTPSTMWAISGQRARDPFGRRQGVLDDVVEEARRRRRPRPAFMSASRSATSSG
jgi:hypothetical protein